VLFWCYDTFKCGYYSEDRPAVVDLHQQFTFFFSIYCFFSIFFFLDLTVYRITSFLVNAKLNSLSCRYVIGMFFLSVFCGGFLFEVHMLKSKGKSKLKSYLQEMVYLLQFGRILILYT